MLDPPFTNAEVKSNKKSNTNAQSITMEFRMKVVLVIAMVVAAIASLLVVSHIYVASNYVRHVHIINNTANNNGLVNVLKTANVTNNTHRSSRPTTPIPGYISFGSLACYNNDVIIPNSSIVILHYRIHGNVSINNIGVYISFPASIINETLSDFSRLQNSSGAMIIGIYVNGRLVMLQTTSLPINSLIFAVNQPYVYDNKPMNLWQYLRATNSTGKFVVNTVISIGFPTINLTDGSGITVAIYSAVPYALPSCKVASDGAEVELMVVNNWIGSFGVSNAVLSARQLYVKGRYVTEEPVIYVVNVTSPISQLPQVLNQGVLTSVKPFITGYAPSFYMILNLPPASQVSGAGSG